MKLVALIYVMIILIGCKNHHFATNLGNVILNKTVKKSLERFPSDKAAHQAGAELLGRAIGSYCRTEEINAAEEFLKRREYKYELRRAQHIAIEDFKYEVLALNGDAFSAPRCQKITKATCSYALTCSGQAYKKKL